MGATAATTLISHWDHMFAGLQQSSSDFYSAVDGVLKAHHLADTKIKRVTIHEGGIFSARREYLEVRRKAHIFHICAAPFGDGFFVSWWLGEKRSGFWALLTLIPVVGRVFAFIADHVSPLTYYRVDTALMFQSVTHSAVLEALDHVTNQSGNRGLSDLERKPVMRDFFGSVVGGGK